MSAKIVKAEFFVTSPSRNFVILQLATGDGVIGVGGASRTGARAYGPASGTDLESLFDSIRYEMELGYTMIRVQTSVPGIEKLYGVAAQEQSSGARYEALLQRLAAVRGRLSLCADQAAAAKWWLSMPMASVSAEGPMPKALSTRRTSPLMPGCRHQGRACPLRRARMTSNPLIVA